MVETAAAHLGWKASSGNCIWPGRSPSYGEDWIEGVVTRLSAAHNAESLANDLAEVDRPSVVLLGLSQKADLSETLEPVLAEVCKDDKFPQLILTEPKSGRNPAVDVQELSAMMGKMGSDNISKTMVKNPGKAFETAGKLARELECGLLIIGSVYLIGDLLKYVVDRDGLDLWNELTVH
jgi:folylpolyglutamate synthase/dihydropteroate synthase